MRKDIFKPEQPIQRKTLSVITVIPQSYTKVDQKKIRIDRAWSRWKMNRQSGTQFHYKRRIGMLMDRYDGLDEGIKREKKCIALVDMLRNKMMSDKSYSRQKNE